MSLLLSFLLFCWSFHCHQLPQSLACLWSYLYQLISALHGENNCIHVHAFTIRVHYCSLLHENSVYRSIPVIVQFLITRALMVPCANPCVNSCCHVDSSLQRIGTIWDHITPAVTGSLLAPPPLQNIYITSHITPFNHVPVDNTIILATCSWLHWCLYF